MCDWPRVIPHWAAGPSIGPALKLRLRLTNECFEPLVGAWAGFPHTSLARHSTVPPFVDICTMDSVGVEEEIKEMQREFQRLQKECMSNDDPAILQCLDEINIRMGQKETLHKLILSQVSSPRR